MAYLLRGSLGQRQRQAEYLAGEREPLPLSAWDAFDGPFGIADDAVGAFGQPQLLDDFGDPLDALLVRVLFVHTQQGLRDEPSVIIVRLTGSLRARRVPGSAAFPWRSDSRWRGRPVGRIRRCAPTNRPWRPCRWGSAGRSPSVCPWCGASSCSTGSSCRHHWLP